MFSMPQVAHGPSHCTMWTPFQSRWVAESDSDGRIFLQQFNGRVVQMEWIGFCMQQATIWLMVEVLIVYFWLCWWLLLLLFVLDGWVFPPAIEWMGCWTEWIDFAAVMIWLVVQVLSTVLVTTYFWLLIDWVMTNESSPFGWGTEFLSKESRTVSVTLPPQFFLFRFVSWRSPLKWMSLVMILSSTADSALPTLLISESPLISTSFCLTKGIV